MFFIQKFTHRDTIEKFNWCYSFFNIWLIFSIYILTRHGRKSVQFFKSSKHRLKSYDRLKSCLYNKQNSSTNTLIARNCIRVCILANTFPPLVFRTVHYVLTMFFLMKCYIYCWYYLAYFCWIWSWSFYYFFEFLKRVSQFLNTNFYL